MKLSPTQIQEIAERAEKATKGPWRVRRLRGMDNQMYIHAENPANLAQNIEVFGEDYPSNIGSREDDFEFGAHARQDIPALLAHIAAQDGERKEINSLLMRELTPSGSEFHDDPRACIEFAKKRMNSFSMSKLAELKAQVAKLERERDEAILMLVRSTATGRTLKGVALENLEYIQRLESGEAEREAYIEADQREIAQLESQIAMKDGALKDVPDVLDSSLRFFQEKCPKNWKSMMTPPRILALLEALKGSAK